MILWLTDMLGDGKYVNIGKYFRMKIFQLGKQTLSS